MICAYRTKLLLKLLIYGDIPVTQAIPNECIDCKSIFCQVLHQSVAQQQSVLHSLFGRGGGDDEWLQLNIGIMPDVGEPDFMAKIPHAHVHGVVEFLFQRKCVASREEFPHGHMSIGSKKWVADSFE